MQTKDCSIDCTSTNVAKAVIQTLRSIGVADVFREGSGKLGEYRCGTSVRINAAYVRRIGACQFYNCQRRRWPLLPTERDGRDLAKQLALRRIEILHWHSNVDEPAYVRVA